MVQIALVENLEMRKRLCCRSMERESQNVEEFIVGVPEDVKSYDGS